MKHKYIMYWLICENCGLRHEEACEIPCKGVVATKERQDNITFCLENELTYQLLKQLCNKSKNKHLAGVKQVIHGGISKQRYAV